MHASCLDACVWHVRPALPSNAAMSPSPCVPSTRVAPAHSAWGSWHCYFHRLTSPACQAAAHAAVSLSHPVMEGGRLQGGRLGSTDVHAGGAEGSEGGGGGMGACRPVAEVGSAVASEARVVCATTHVRASAAVQCCDGDAGAEPSGKHPAEAAAALLGGAWQQVVVRGARRGAERCTEKQQKVQWWRAQALRFMLRWPSPYLCHLLNRHRHRAYGMQVARGMATHHAEAQGILSSLLLPPLAARHPIAARALQQEGRELAALNFSTPHSVEAQVWPGLGFHGCVARGRGNVMATPGNPLSDYFGAGREAYVLRPIVAMDTGRRRGVERPPMQHLKEDEQDKEEGEDEEVGRSGQEGELEERGRREQMAVVASVFHAYSLRQHDPDLHHVWLTASPSQATQTQLAAFDDWTFLNSRHDSYGQSAAASMAGVVGSQLASVLIAAESDYFVGSLASRHTRLILALRATNDRLAAPAVLLK
ncbi:unnamed protein product [Closterium sp. NIES-65]|nr:unnamed protein product [Closterium sp. NIES-65]